MHAISKHQKTAHFLDASIIDIGTKDALENGLSNLLFKPKRATQWRPDISRSAQNNSWTVRVMRTRKPGNAGVGCKAEWEKPTVGDFARVVCHKNTDYENQKDEDKAYSLSACAY